MSLPIVRTVADLRARVAAWKAAGDRVGLVPTMGALHEGHLSLVRLARTRAHRVVASVFVNPTQFAPNEDFDAYPRSEARDAELLESAGCDLLFAPDVGEMYPDGFATTITVSGVSEPLDGQARPGHFAGVATVVAKLLNQAQPHVAVFGEKDYQQLQVIRRLVRDLDLPVEIVGGPTARAEDGLALSSRNAYLSHEERLVAARLNQVLREAVAALNAGERVDAVETRAVDALTAAGYARVDYVEVRDAADLSRIGPGPADRPARILAAAVLGRTRLIDNMAV
ncbi:pantoate--beta-alanine ligase [Phenylobacterium sp.]|uniref:pantoate--beta-alanine ligase n=1 Tax=Phenylobacterium sp. TaxID=1871053 RepID=UPI0028114C3B|nr:pantoate--beta-alanine ligase [Phenylobacterium sp.]